MSKLEKMQGEAGRAGVSPGGRQGLRAVSSFMAPTGKTFCRLSGYWGAVTWITGSMDSFKMGFSLQPLNCQILEKILCLNNLPCLQTRSFILGCFPEGRVHVCVCVCACAPARQLQAYLRNLVFPHPLLSMPCRMKQCRWGKSGDQGGAWAVAGEADARRAGGR